MLENQFNFDKLIWPMEADTFFSEYWEQRPLVVSGRQPNYYSNLFSMQDVESTIYTKRRDTTKIGVFHKSKPYFQHFQADLNSSSFPGINQIYDAYSQGNTVNSNSLQYSCKKIAILCRNLENFFNFKVNVNMYLTPKKSQGFLAHFDTHDVFILQIEGAKLWHIYDSFRFLPMEEDQQRVPEDKLPSRLHEVRLSAGDLLYIPRGYVHEALTSECSSLHLTVGIHPFRLADLIFSALTFMSQQNVSFRKSLPVGFLNNGETTGLLKHQFKELLELLSNSVIEEAFEQLAEQFFTRLEPLPDGHFTQIDDVNSIDSETVVKKRNGMICHVLKEENSVSIQFPGNIVKAPSYIEPALRFITDSGEFPIKSIPDTLTDNEKLVLVRRLVREGLLTIAQKE